MFGRKAEHRRGRSLINLYIFTYMNNMTSALYNKFAR